MMGARLLLIFVVYSIIKSVSAVTYTCNPQASCGCSSLSTVVTTRIIGGEKASNHTWNWIVSFQQYNRHKCAATLLTSEYAVTAAHCIDELSKDVSNISILAGTNYLTDSSSATMQRRPIIQMIMHPDYNNDTNVNDVGIIRFPPLDISSNSNINSICLPQGNQDPFQASASLVAIGWGVTYDSPYALVSDYLQQVTVQAYSATSDDCVRSGMTNSSTQFCAGVSEGGKDTCQGDSGGPLMAFSNNRWILAGITSMGEGCALAGLPGVYTRVSRFIPFIDAHVGSPSTVPVTATTTEQNLNRTTILKNNVNILDKSISLSMMCLLFVIFAC